MNYSNTDIINGLKIHNKEIVLYIYKNYFNNIANLVKKNNGSDADAKDIFQESLIAIYNKCQNESFYISCNFSSLLYSIAQRIWLNELRRRKVRTNSEPKLLSDFEIENSDNLNNDNNNIEIVIEYEKDKLFSEHFQNLLDDCKQILLLFFNNISLKEIGEKMGYKTENSARVKKHKCKEYLVNEIKNDSRYKKLMVMGLISKVE